MSERDDLPGASAWPFERKCPECGKVFAGTILEAWTYRNKSDLFCSWTCLRKRERRIKEQEQKKARKKRMARQLKPNQKEALIRAKICRGMTNEEISAETGFSTQLVNYYRRKIEEAYADEG